MFLWQPDQKEKNNKSLLAPPQTKPTTSGGFLAEWGKYIKPELLSDCERSSSRIWKQVLFVKLILLLNVYMEDIFLVV